MRQDLRFALRQLLKNPGFSIVAVLTLALAIGANSAIFSAIDAVLLHPLPYREPDRLVFVGEDLKHFDLSKIPASPPEVNDYRTMATSFSAIGAVENSTAFTLTGGNNPEIIPGMSVTASMFTMLGVKPVVGGLFTAENEQPGKNHVAVISEGLWKRRFGGDPSIAGKRIEINQESYVVTGVIQPILEFRLAGDLWTPISFTPSQLAPDARGSQYIDVLGRLRPGVTLAQANAEFQTIASRLKSQHPDFYKPEFGYSLAVYPLAEKAIGGLKTPLLVLIGAVGVVMLIACVNVSNLLLARAMERRKEISIRVALGAARGRVVRQLLTESVLLAMLAGALGLGLALWGLRLYGQFGPHNLIRGPQPAINGWVMAFTVALSFIASVIFGLAPALETSRIDLNDALKESSRGVTGGRRLLRESMVAIEVAASLMLLIGAGLLVRSFVRLERADPGFRADNVLTGALVLPVNQYKQPAQIAAFETSLLERVSSLPGVEKAAAIDLLPFSGQYSAGAFEIVGHPHDPNTPQPVVIKSLAAPGYLEALGIRLIRGRWFTGADVSGSTPVAVIDETVAKRFFPNLDPIGMQITSPKDGINGTIVGIAGATKYRDLSAPPEPTIYYAAAQNPSPMIHLAIKTAGDPLKMVAAVRHEVAQLDPNLPLSRVNTMESALALSLAQERFSIQLMTVFASLAAVLAALGIYGVLAYLVDQRRRELGIRIALGATRANVLALVMRQGSTPVAIGIAVGIAGAFALTGVLKSLLFEVSATDPVIFAAITIGLTIVSLAAMAIPARRASRVNATEVLRHE
ncbi:MAG TPA: ABC transporter permease [Bryobacteraceae bacterium]|jgi:putative ABC transport system permease protein|nr:ABC transporter permease [Bryobacteraceae bacterium]